MTTDQVEYILTWLTVSVVITNLCPLTWIEEVSFFWLVLLLKKHSSVCLISSQLSNKMSFRWRKRILSQIWRFINEVWEFGKVAGQINPAICVIYRFFPDCNLLTSVGLIWPVWGLMHLLVALVTPSTLTHFPFWFVCLCKESTRSLHTHRFLLSPRNGLWDCWHLLFVSAVIGEDVYVVLHVCCVDLVTTWLYWHVV